LVSHAHTARTDLGTTKICAIALDADSGAMIALEETANDTRLAAEADASEQDAPAISPEHLISEF